MIDGIEIEPGYAGSRVVLTGPWHPRVGEYMRATGISELYLNHARGWRGRDVEFVRDLPGLTGFGLLDFTIADDSPVHYLTHLRALELSTYSQSAVDFHAFPELAWCAFYWRANSESLFDAPVLSDLFVHRYDGTSSEPFGVMRSLRALSIANGELTEIAMLGRLGQLRRLGLYNLKRLRSLAGLEQLTELEELEVNGCKGIGSIDELAALVHLRRLQLNDDGPISTLGPIRSATGLEELLFYESTNVRDGDLSVLDDLPQLRRVSFQNRRHYSRRREQFTKERTES